MARVVVLHTSDFHSRLDSQHSRRLREIKEASGECLLLDSGDAIRSGNVTFNPFGETALAMMNDAGYDAMCIGNREYHFLSVPMKAKTFKAAFPLLSANLIKKEDTSGVQAYVDFVRNEVRIRVMGLSVPCVTREMFVHRLSHQFFEDPIKCGIQTAQKLRKGCDILIALTHIGLRKDIELAERSGLIDLILGGHTHTITEPPVIIGKTVILHHGFYARHVGQVTMDYEDGLLQVDNKLLELKR